MKISECTDNDLEMLDVVDENDVVLKQMPKKEVHAGKHILHREIGVIIFDENHNVLLQQRSFKKKYFPGTWSVSAVGHVPAGMTPEEAAHMELREELGFDTPLTFLEKRMYHSGEHTSFGFLFTGIFPKDVKIKIDRNEVEQAKFVSKEEIIQMEKDGIIDYHTVETLNKFYQ